MYCYHLSRILPCQGRASVCPNMPIMAYHGLTKCISRHRTQVFHLVTTSSLIQASDRLPSDWPGHDILGILIKSRIIGADVR